MIPYKIGDKRSIYFKKVSDSMRECSYFLSKVVDDLFTIKNLTLMEKRDLAKQLNFQYEMLKEDIILFREFVDFINKEVKP